MKRNQLKKGAGADNEKKKANPSKIGSFDCSPKNELHAHNQEREQNCICRESEKLKKKIARISAEFSNPVIRGKLQR